MIIGVLLICLDFDLNSQKDRKELINFINKYPCGKPEQPHEQKLFLMVAPECYMKCKLKRIYAATNNNKIYATFATKCILGQQNGYLTCEYDSWNIFISNVTDCPVFCNTCLKSKKEIREKLISFKNFKVCSSCHTTRYCSKKCQKIDWLHHKKMCHRIKMCKLFMYLFHLSDE